MPVNVAMNIRRCSSMVVKYRNPMPQKTNLPTKCFYHMDTKILQPYITYVLEHNKRPGSIYLFAKSVNLTEAEFYTHYSSFSAMESDIMLHTFQTALEKAQQEEVYAGYSAREKLLSLFYTWIEQLKEYRSFIQFLHQDTKMPRITPVFLHDVRSAFVAFAQQLVQEGIERQEISERKYITDKYAESLWAQVLFILHFWLRDNSKGFEKTDEAIEKSVNLAFDLMSRSAIDTAMEFARFLFHNKSMA